LGKDDHDAMNNLEKTAPANKKPNNLHFPCNHLEVVKISESTFRKGFMMAKETQKIVRSDWRHHYGQFIFWSS
jgi:hypothetical protein